MAKSNIVRKGKSVRITNVTLGEKQDVARRYLDRTGTVLRVSRKNGTALVSFNNRTNPMEIALDKLEVA